MIYLNSDISKIIYNNAFNKINFSCEALIRTEVHNTLV